MQNSIAAKICFHSSLCSFQLILPTWIRNGIPVDKMSKNMWYYLTYIPVILPCIVIMKECLCAIKHNWSTRKKGIQTIQISAWLKKEKAIEVLNIGYFFVSKKGPPLSEYHSINSRCRDVFLKNGSHDWSMTLSWHACYIPSSCFLVAPKPASVETK